MPATSCPAGGPSVVCIEAASPGALSQSQTCAWMTQRDKGRKTLCNRMKPNFGPGPKLCQYLHLAISVK